MGFQYKGQLSIATGDTDSKLSTAGITGISSSYRDFKNTADTGSVLVYFTETGLAHFTSQPLHELFNLSVGLDNVFNKKRVELVEEKLTQSKTDRQRIQVVERFLLSQLNDLASDRLVIEAIRLIYENKGNVRISQLNQTLLTSKSPLEKRFRRLVGTTPKKFAAIVRFNSVLDSLHSQKSLTEICYENNFFDQAHFIKDFRQFTGDSPDNFKRRL